MTEEELFKLRFPIGKFQHPKEINEKLIGSWISILETFPAQLEDALSGVSEEALDYAYRPDGWSVKQVVHHLADSHMNAFIRTKMALTEDGPTIKAYIESGFAKLPDANNYEIGNSLMILKGLHARYVSLLKSMSEQDFGRTYVHPESKYTYRMDGVLALYAWHSMHHLGHVKQALSSGGAYNSVEGN